MRGPRVFAVLLLALALVGCNYELPHFDSASIEVYDGPKVLRGELSSAQIAILSDWFREHREGWRYEIADRYPETLIVLRRGMDMVAVIDIRRSEVVAAQFVHPISAEERAQLVLLITSFLEPKEGANQTPEPTRMNAGHADEAPVPRGSF